MNKTSNSQKKATQKWRETHTEQILKTRYSWRERNPELHKINRSKDLKTWYAHLKEEGNEENYRIYLDKKKLINNKHYHLKKEINRLSHILLD